MERDRECLRAEQEREIETEKETEHARRRRKIGLDKNRVDPPSLLHLYEVRHYSSEGDRKTGEERLDDPPSTNRIAARGRIPSGLVIIFYEPIEIK